MCSLSCIGGGGEGRGAAGRGRPTCHYLRMGVTGWKEEKGRSGSSALPVHSAISPSPSLSPSPRLYTHSVQRLLVGKVGTCQRCSTSAHRVAREHQRAPAGDGFGNGTALAEEEIECSWTRTWVRRPCEEVGRGEGAPSLKTHPSRKQGETISK